MKLNFNEMASQIIIGIAIAFVCFVGTNLLSAWNSISTTKMELEQTQIAHKQDIEAMQKQFDKLNAQIEKIVDTTSDTNQRLAHIEGNMDYLRK